MPDTGAVTQKVSRFAGFEQEERKPWEDGWYSGVFIAEYETSGNFAAVHKTEDTPNRSGDSRNLKLCVVLVNGSDTMNRNMTINYRPEALDPEYMKELRDKIAKKERLGDGFRDSMSLSRLHELERAGIPLEDNGHGGFDVDKIIELTADFYLSTRIRKENDKDDRAVTAEEKKVATDEDKKKWSRKITKVAAVDTKVKR